MDDPPLPGFSAHRGQPLRLASGASAARSLSVFKREASRSGSARRLFRGRRVQLRRHAAAAWRRADAIDRRRSWRARCWAAKPASKQGSRPARASTRRSSRQARPDRGGRRPNRTRAGNGAHAATRCAAARADRKLRHGVETARTADPRGRWRRRATPSLEARQQALDANDTPSSPRSIRGWPGWSAPAPNDARRLDREARARRRHAAKVRAREADKGLAGSRRRATVTSIGHVLTWC